MVVVVVVVVVAVGPAILKKLPPQGRQAQHAEAFDCRPQPLGKLPDPRLRAAQGGEVFRRAIEVLRQEAFPQLSQALVHRPRLPGHVVEPRTAERRCRRLRVRGFRRLPRQRGLCAAGRSGKLERPRLDLLEEFLEALEPAIANRLADRPRVDVPQAPLHAVEHRGSDLAHVQPPADAVLVGV